MFGCIFLQYFIFTLGSNRHTNRQLWTIWSNTRSQMGQRIYKKLWWGPQQGIAYYAHLGVICQPFHAGLQDCLPYEPKVEGSCKPKRCPHCFLDFFSKALRKSNEGVAQSLLTSLGVDCNAFLISFSFALPKSLPLICLCPGLSRPLNFLKKYCFIPVLLRFSDFLN